MNTHLDRELQLELLRALAERFPSVCSVASLGHDPQSQAVIANLAYLKQHELIDAEIVQYIDGGMNAHTAAINAAGMDFLAEDGGLSAILSVVTVRLDAEQLRDLIGRHVEKSALPNEEKSQIMKWLQSAKQEALKQATTRLVAAALDRLPGAIDLVRSLPGLGP